MTDIKRLEFLLIPCCILCPSIGWQPLSPCCESVKILSGQSLTLSLRCFSRLVWTCPGEGPPISRCLLVSSLVPSYSGVVSHQVCVPVGLPVRLPLPVSLSTRRRGEYSGISSISCDYIIDLLKRTFLKIQKDDFAADWLNTHKTFTDLIAYFVIIDNLYSYCWWWGNWWMVIRASKCFTVSKSSNFYTEEYFTVWFIVKFKACHL